jgi:molybdopterin molybdotransferase
MITVSQAEALIRDHMPRFPPRAEPLAACVGRVLAAAVRAERDQPPFDRVTMDGIAIAYGDYAAGAREFAVIGTQAAGQPPLALSAARQCVAVMTGAMLPGGADTIIPIERITRSSSSATIAAGATVTAGQFVHLRGSDRKAGSVLLPAGMVIGAPEMAVLASAGRGSIAVAALPHAAVVSTGDELVDVDEPIAAHQIRSSNDRALAASFERSRTATVTRAHLRDDSDALASAVARLHDESDVLVLSGGVSMGEFDFVPAVLEKLGARVVFHRIAQRPGKPMWFGVSAAGKPIFALPGNPVSALVCATRYVLPALRAAAGAPPSVPERVRLASPVTPSPELTYFMPVCLSWSDDGTALAAPRPTNTSGDFATLAGTDGFVELAAARAAYAAGTPVRLFHW